MAHFAELGEDNVVLRVIVVANDDCKDESGNESEAIGASFCRDLLGGTWKQTSYNGNMRKNYAGVGYKYDSALDAFVPPKPFPSWTLNEETANWEAPVAHPGDGLWTWNEEDQQWDEVVIAE